MVVLSQVGSMPVIIDGHNVIGQMSSISLADPNDEEKLVKLLARHLLQNRQKTIVVFDKGSGKDMSLGRKVPRLKVIFAPQESSADAIIIKMIKRDPNPKGLTIVSSDNEIRRCARSRRARLVSAEDFAQQLESGPKRPRKRRTYDDELETIDVAEWSDFFKKGRE